MPNIETIVAWLWPWAVGLFVSLGIGHLVTDCFNEYLPNWMKRSKTRPLRLSPILSHRRVPSWLTGLVKRLLFTVLVGADAEGVLTGMMAWLALKMATNWNFAHKNSDPREFALAALLAGVVSMLFAFLGGMTRRFFTHPL